MIWRRLFGYLPANIAGGLASFGGVIVYTRLMTPEDYGRYALVLTFMSAVHTLTATWAEAAAYRFAGEAEAKGRLAAHVRTVMRLIAASTGVGLVLMLATLPFAASAELKLAILFAVAVMALQPLVAASQEMLRAQQRVARHSMVRIALDLGAFAVGALVAWRAGLGAAAPLAGLALMLAVAAISEGARLWHESAGGAFERGQVKRYIGYGYPVALSLVLTLALDAGDRFMIALYLGTEAVGVYAAGYGVADKTVALICAWAAAAGAPMMMAAWEKDGPAAMRLVSASVARTLMLAAAPAAVGLALVSQPLADIMIGEAMREQAARIMPWIALAGLLNGFVLYYLSEAFQLAERTGLRAGLMVVPAVANVALNAVLLPWIGLMGAVYATVACYALALVLLAAASRRIAPLAWPWRDYARIAGACAAMAIVVRLLPATGGWSELMMKAAAGAMTYTLAVLAFDAAGARGALSGLIRKRMTQA
jgi:O-antigen/teichoic acid export membrane protein